MEYEGGILKVTTQRIRIAAQASDVDNWREDKRYGTQSRLTETHLRSLAVESRGGSSQSVPAFGTSFSRPQGFCRSLLLVLVSPPKKCDKLSSLFPAACFCRSGHHRNLSQVAVSSPWRNPRKCRKCRLPGLNGRLWISMVCSGRSSRRRSCRCPRRSMPPLTTFCTRSRRKVASMRFGRKCGQNLKKGYVHAFLFFQNPAKICFCAAHRGLRSWR